MRYLSLLALLTGCGVTVHSDPVQVNPITVNHVVTVNLDSVTNYCTASCVSNQDPIHCSQNCYDTFLTILNAATQTNESGGTVQ